jgi:hypothetical protein
MENSELISSALGIVPGAIATLGIFLEKRRTVIIALGAMTLLTLASIITTIITDNTSELAGSMIGLTMPIVAGGLKSFFGNSTNTNS